MINKNCLVNTWMGLLVPDDQKLLLELDQVFTRMKKLRDNLLDYSQ